LQVEAAARDVQILKQRNNEMVRLLQQEQQYMGSQTA
jgi:hypothetical protein